MTPEEFKRLPPLMHRSDVLAAGISAEALDSLRVDLTDARWRVPFGKIGAIRGLARKRGRKGKGYRLYRKSDVAAILGGEYQNGING